MYNSCGAKGVCRYWEISWLKTGRGSSSQLWPTALVFKAHSSGTMIDHVHLSRRTLGFFVVVFLLLFSFFCFIQCCVLEDLTWPELGKNLHEIPAWRALPLILTALRECFFTADFVFFEWKESVNLLTYIRGAFTTYIFVLYILPSGGPALGKETDSIQSL